MVFLMNNLLETYKHVINIAESMNKDDVFIRITPAVKTDELIEKYSGLDNLPHDLWIKISFLFLSKNASTIVFDAKYKLMDNGIFFDTGGGYANITDQLKYELKLEDRSYVEYDWFVDWSFKIENKDKNETHL